MHNASTKQRLAALRRKLGVFTGWQPRWVRERRKRLERLALSAAGGTLVGPPPPADEVATELAPAPAATLDEVAPAPAASSGSVAAVVPAPTASVAAAVPAPTVLVAPAAPAAAVDPASQATTELVMPPAGITTPLSSAARAFIAPAPAPAKRPGRPVPRSLIAALVLAAILAGIFALARRGPGEAGPAAVAGLERASGRDAQVPAAAPAPLSDDGARGRDPALVEVRPGDTLWHLAAVHLGDPMRWPELHSANVPRIQDPDLIYPGQQLRVPRVAARL